MLTAATIASRAAALAAHALANLDRCPQAASEVAEWVVRGAHRCDAAEHARRLAVCHACKHWRTDPDHCAVCKCLAGKLWLKTARCPLASPLWT